MDVLEKISSQLDGYSKGQYQIATYILEHFEKAAFMTAQKLGLTVGVSESTVVRFAYSLGYDGYPGLSSELKSIIRNKLTAVQRVELTNEQMGSEDVLQNVMQHDAERIRKTFEGVDKKEFNEVVKSILGARNVYIMGSRSSESIASFLEFYLKLMLSHVKKINTTSVSDIYEQLLNINKDDVFIGISFPRYAVSTIKAMSFAKDNGAKVISITDSNNSPIAKNADHLLLCKSDMASFVDSLVAPMSLANALIIAIGLQKKDKVSETFNKLERIWDEYQVYEISN